MRFSKKKKGEKELECDSGEENGFNRRLGFSGL